MESRYNISLQDSELEMSNALQKMYITYISITIPSSIKARQVHMHCKPQVIILL